MKYAIFEMNGRQYQAIEGKSLTVNTYLGEKEKNVKFEHVLLFSDKDKTLIGCPFVEEITIEGKILKSGKSQKIHVRKFKAKVRYRRNVGFRPLQSDVLIEKIKTTEKPKLKKDSENKPRTRRKKTT